MNPQPHCPECGAAWTGEHICQFVVDGESLQEARRRNRDHVDSSKRTWKIQGSPGAQGAYAHPINWPMTAAQVVAEGPDHYCANVRAWAESIYATLKASGNLG